MAPHMENWNWMGSSDPWIGNEVCYFLLYFGFVEQCRQKESYTLWIMWISHVDNLYKRDLPVDNYVDNLWITIRRYV